MKKKLLFILGIISLIVGCSLNFAGTSYADGKLKVVTTFYPVYEFTKEIVGDEGDVSMLIKAGTEPHDFEPSTKDIAKIQKANTFVYMDDNMETWVKDVNKSMDDKGPTFIKGTGDMLLLPGSSDHDHAHHGGKAHTHQYDPHVWLSPKRAKTVVANIRDSLIKAHPEKEAVFTKNASDYLKKLSALDKNYETALSKAKQKSFVTQHAAFSYLALDYGLNQIAITGVSAESEPSAKRLAQLAKYVKKYAIKYIYFEETASSKVAQTLANEAGVKTAVLSPIESLTNEQEKSGASYISLMKGNLKALKKTTDIKGKAIKAENDKTAKTVSKGYFNTKDVKDRTLSDWSGTWQSVYPYLQDGTLDQVWDYKAKLNKDQTAEEYKTYYTTGYKTDVTKIKIDGKKNTMTFTQNGKDKTFTYKYVGHKILNYKKGNRGVRYLFETDNKDAGQFKYVQFSDHGIEPQKAAHFHLFWGDSSQEEVLKELENWPTYYPENLSGHDIAQEMIAH